MGDSHNEAEDIVADAIKLNSDDLNEKVSFGCFSQQTSKASKASYYLEQLLVVDDHRFRELTSSLLSPSSAQEQSAEKCKYSGDLELLD